MVERNLSFGVLIWTPVQRKVSPPWEHTTWLWPLHPAFPHLVQGHELHTHHGHTALHDDTPEAGMAQKSQSDGLTLARFGRNLLQKSNII